MTPFRIRCAVPAALALLLASCASYTTDRPVALEDVPGDWNRLPYHIAVIPTNDAEAEGTGAGADRKGAAFDFQFGPLHGAPDDVITTSLASTMEASAFRKVTVLTPPTEAEIAALGDDLLDAYWVTAAREAKADLLLDVKSFSYPEKPTSRAEPLSFLLYLFGPVELLFPDRQYSFDEVQLAVSLYEVGSLDVPQFGTRTELTSLAVRAGAGEVSEAFETALNRARRFELASDGELREFRLTPDDLEYRFGDRLGKGPASPSFWPSIVIPSALLQKNSAKFSERLTNDVAQALGHDLARDIVEGDFAYIVDPESTQSGLLFDARGASLVQSTDYGDVLELRARIRKPSSAMARNSIWIAGRELAIELDAPGVIGADSIESALSRQAVLGRTNPATDAAGEFTHDLVVYVPSPAGQGVWKASSMPMEAVTAQMPVDVVQLRLGENLGARGIRAKSWSFPLDEVLEEEAIQSLEAERDAEVAETLRVSLDAN